MPSVAVPAKWSRAPTTAGTELRLQQPCPHIPLSDIHPIAPLAAWHRCRLRISLGLKPLKVEDAQPAGPSKEELAKKEEEEKAAKAEELADRVRL